MSIRKVRKISIYSLPVLFTLLGLTAFLLSCDSDSGSAPDRLVPPPVIQNAAPKKIPLPDVSPAEPYSVDVIGGIPIVRENDPEKKKIYLNLYLPKGKEGEKFPAVLMATAYRREFMIAVSPYPEETASQGYAVIIMDSRGTGSSEGTWGFFAEEEIKDIVHVIDHWIPQQEWSNGKVGMYGGSYMGINQFLTAAYKPTHLKAIFPNFTGADIYRDLVFQGGIFNQEFVLSVISGAIMFSQLPSTQLFADFASAQQAHEDHLLSMDNIIPLLTPVDGPHFDRISPMSYWEETAELPVFLTAGWWDIFCRGSFLNYMGLMEKSKELEAANIPAGPKGLIVGPWYHATAIVTDGVMLNDLHMRWFDWHLKLDEDPNYRNYSILDPNYPVTIYVMGKDEEGNEHGWRREKAWPLARAQYKTLYLSGEKQLLDKSVSLNNGSMFWAEDLAHGGNGASLPDTPPTLISYNPNQASSEFPGIPSRSFVTWMAGALFFLGWGEDERENEKKLLTFTTAPLERDIEVTGPMTLRFWARSHFDVPVDPPNELWWGYGNAMGIDISWLIPWAQQQNVHWVIGLNDVFPDGRSRNISSGWLAASHRPLDPSRPNWTEPGYDPFDYPEYRNPAPLEDGELYECVVEIWPTSNVFAAGNQIRIDIGTADIPHFLFSLMPSESEILHDPAHPARLILPVVDQDSTNPEQWIENPTAYFAGKGPWLEQ